MTLAEGGPSPASPSRGNELFPRRFSRPFPYIRAIR